MKRLACILLILTIAISWLFTFEVPHAQTNGSVTLNSNTEWTAAQNPINLNGSVTVNSNVTLTIDPGVTVNFGNYMSIIVYGTLIAQGNANNQIVFACNGDQTLGPYTAGVSITSDQIGSSGIVNSSESIIQNTVLNDVNVYVDSGMSLEVENCVFNYASPYEPPIDIQANSMATISNNIINYNIQNYQYGVNVIDVDANALITDNQFEGSFGGSNNAGIAVNGGSPVILGNTFEAQYGNNSYGTKVNSGNPQISSNQFDGNGWLIGIDDLSISAFTVSNNVFSDCLSGVKDESSGPLTVQGNQFLSGTDGIDIFPTASVTVTDNLINGNSKYGINGGGTITSNTISNNQIGIHNPPSGIISYNNIVGNTVNSITTTVENVNAQNNWWGTTDTATINQTIYDTKVDPRLGTVLFVPFLTQPSTSAPPIPSYTPAITPIPTQIVAQEPTTTPTLLPTPTPYQYSQTFEYQVGSLINLNLITTAVGAMLVLVWVIVILGYAAKRVISKHWVQ